MNPKVDNFIEKAKKWQDEMEKLRMIVLDCQLKEELKWGVPCYTYQDSNVVLIHGFKEYCALLFFKGALLSDPDKILVRQTENVQAGRQIRFTQLSQIVELEPILKSYIFEAVEIQKAGLEVQFKKPAEATVPAEFQKSMDEFPELKLAFERLTPGRQRAYLLYFSDPKQSKTRESRIEKSIPNILSGRGLNEEYVRKVQK